MVPGIGFHTMSRIHSLILLFSLGAILFAFFHVTITGIHFGLPQTHFKAEEKEFLNPLKRF
ncbi:MAG: hypothetical protein ACE5OP_07000 [Candidatus Glassbacteria bacterium]